ncbi:hypothetical protein MSSIH_0187 [Methanosarcina siciliae HI350]|uniref:Archaeal Type IV pilin N-terminal domain-containing protein n=2 Tax=Methanosarcina siciliae TaxID=38027 RepID=A0A0E3P9V8_9EURY|nr:type IV pilin N-terminal domain-containing protein [Methanosarcina siciliae]AKB30877.1 hypothetical protein MSSIH_0187 [Methanosarcina siciliae HI350]
MPGIKELMKKCTAVSDVVGEVLMTTIAVIFISSIAVFIFSYDGAADVPHTHVKEWTDSRIDTIYLEHNGGEFIETEALEIAININGNRYTYSSPQIYANLGNKSSWELGDRIEINTDSEWNVDIKDEDEINVYLIDRPSRKVFQNLRLSTKESANSGWHTPQGSAVDTSEGGSAILLHVQKENDGLYTSYHPPVSQNDNTYEEFNFGLSAAIWRENITSVTLKLVYSGNNNTCEQIKLKLWDESSGTWQQQNLPEHTSFTAYSTDLSSYINNTTDLENLKIQLVATGNAGASTTNLHVDYTALYVS